MSTEIKWLVVVEENFDAKGSGGSDFHYLLTTMLREENISFPQLVCDAALGNGCTVHEGLSYSLDQDWDYPDHFDEVCFFVGEIESSSLTIDDYVDLVKIACDSYCRHFSVNAEAVKRNLQRLIHRYKK